MATRRQAVIGLFFVTLLWGGTFVWMKQAMNSLELELDEYSKAGVIKKYPSLELVRIEKKFFNKDQ